MTEARHSSASPRIVEWGVGARSLDGQGASGDLHVVVPLSHGALVAAIDGLGHGDEAAIAARVASATMIDCAGESVTTIISRCHDALRRTRGAVISVASFNAEHDTMTWLGVGNVEGLLLRADAAARSEREALVLSGGVVGYQLPPLRATVHPVFRGDILMFATDGISDGFGHEPIANRHPQDVADQILLHHAKGSDDALILVARYVGEL